MAKAKAKATSPGEPLFFSASRLGFLDAQKKSREHPGTFGAPSIEDLAQLSVGDYVKVCYAAERFWIEIRLIGHGGNMMGFPIDGPLGDDPIAFEPRHVLGIEPGDRDRN